MNHFFKERFKSTLYNFLSFIVKKGYDQTLLGCVVKAIDDNSQNYLRYKLYPKKVDTFSSDNSLSLLKEGEIAIVLQGPVELKDNFTLKTVQLYKRLYPKAILIISTWDNTDSSVVSTLQEEGCEVILNKTFDSAGFGNVNYQICTSLNGIIRAKELGAKYTLKSRADQRIYKNYGIEFLKSLLFRYPVINRYRIPLNSRIIGLEGYRGSRYYAYWMQDYLYFGETEDLEKLFSIEYDNRTKEECANLINKNGILNFSNGKEYCETIPAEIFIMKSFLSKYIHLDGTMKQYWELVKHYFVILGFDDLDILWKKYPSTDAISQWSSFYNGSRAFREEERSHNYQFFCSLNEGQIGYKEEVEHMCEKTNYTLE